MKFILVNICNLLRYIFYLCIFTLLLHQQQTTKNVFRAFVPVLNQLVLPTVGMKL